MKNGWATIWAKRDVYKRQDYTSPEPEKSFGLLDEETNCYIELPMEWEGNLKLTDSEQYDGAVELRTDVYKRQDHDPLLG